MQSALTRVLALCLLVWATAFPLFAQSAVTVTTYAGGTSAGSLASGVSALNGTGGNLVFQISATGGGVTLSGPLSIFSQSTSFVGATGTSVPGVNLVGQTSAESTLLFQNNFYLGPGNHLNLTDIGSGLNAGITAANIYLDSGSGSGTNAGDGGFLSTSGSSGLTGQAGGTAFWQAGSVTMNSIIGGNITGGTGGAVTDTGGTNDTGGAGGGVSFGTASWNLLSGSNFSLNGGAGGAVTDASGSTGGAGGGVSLLMGSLNETGSSGLFVNGGSGQSGNSGGAGGAVTVATNAMTVSGSNWILNGGKGGDGTAQGGAGGAASVTWNSLSETQGAAVNLLGGNGGQGVQGGAGGNLSAKGVSIQESGSASNLNLDAGAGGTGTTGTGGNGGNAALTMTGVQLTNGTAMALLGGNGGSSNSGTGGNGGSAAVSIGTIDVEGGSSLGLNAGAGGSSASGTGGNGGSALVLAQSVTLATGGNLTLKGGDGASGGAAGGVGVGFQDAFIDTGSTLNLVTGSSTTGPVGVVVASIGDLTGAGDIVVTGSGSVLQVGVGSFGGVLSGTASLIQNSSAGALTLSGANSYSGGTTVGGGALVLDTGGSLGTGGVFVQASKTLQYIDQASAGFENVANSGLMLFNGQSTAGDAQIVDNGAVSFEDNSTAGAATFNLSGAGLVDFGDQAQGGTARFILDVNSVIDLSTSAAGVVTVGSVEGSGFVSLGAGALAVGSNGVSTDFAGQISDGGAGGSLIKLGGGALTLVGGDNQYSGGTILEQGQLVLGDPFTVSGGVTSASSFNYLGTGSVTLAGGELSMASSTGSNGLLQVGGNYVQNAGATLQLAFYGAGLSGADAIDVTGMVTLGGTLDLAAGQGFQATTVLGTGTQLITGAGLTGHFQNIEESFGGTMRLLPIYTPDSLLISNIILSFADEASTPNQKAVAADLDAVYLAPDLGQLILALGGQSDAVSLRIAYDQLSPSSFSVLYQSAFESSLLQASEVEDRLAQLRENTQVAPPPVRRASLESARFAGNLSVADEMAMIVHPAAPSDGGGVWGGFFSGGGGLFTVNSTPNAPGFKDTSYGVPAAGIDYQVSRELALGFLAGYGESDISLNANGSITQTGAQVGLYGTWHPNRAYVDALVVGGLNQYSSQRQTYDGDVGGKTQGFEINGRLTGGYDWKGKDWSLGPSLAAQWTHVALNGFTEKGSVDTLVLPDQSQDSIMSLASFHAQARIHVGGIFFEPEAAASWEHEFAYQGGVVQAGFGQGDNFSVQGPSVGQDGFLVRGSLNTAFTPQLILSLGYQGELGRTNLTSDQFDAGMKFGF